jgi:hypothetical protein
MDMAAWAAVFTEDSTFTDESTLWLPAGTPPTGRRMDEQGCDVFEPIDGKIKRFGCYSEGAIVVTRLGVIDNLGAVLVP